MWKSPLRAESAARAKSVEMIAQGRLRYREHIFFFRAEGGIRDGTVTGVQTCALPILRVDGKSAGHHERKFRVFEDPQRLEIYVHGGRRICRQRVYRPAASDERHRHFRQGRGDRKSVV